jgi:hypothetical protein
MLVLLGVEVPGSEDGRSSRVNGGVVVSGCRRRCFWQLLLVLLLAPLDIGVVQLWFACSAPIEERAG